MDGRTKKNKAEIWKSNDAWGIKTIETPRRALMYIENISKNKVLGATNDRKVILQDFAEDNPKQLWKGMPDIEGYFVLENFELPMVLTAVSFDSLEIKGLIAMQESND